jgi:aspartate/tyrosine/aromatic aminotransferase
MDARSIADMIQAEHPQVVAIILSVLENVVAADVLSFLPADSRAEVMQRVAKLETVQPSAMEELEAMRVRVEELRGLLVSGLKALRPEVDYSFVQRQKGMFSLLPLSTMQIQRLRDEHHIYLPGDGRINVAGISRRNVEYVAQSLAVVI